MIIQGFLNISQISLLYNNAVSNREMETKGWVLCEIGFTFTSKYELVALVVITGKS